MTGTKVVEVPMKDLKNTFFARRELNNDRVIFLAELMERNEPIEPITVVEGTHEVIDGRHRIAAADLLGRETIIAKFVKPQPKPKLIAAALEANYGGALPPTGADIDYVIRQLLTEKVAIGKICELLAFIPEGLLRAHTRDIKKMDRRRKVATAISRVAEGATVFEAARELDIDPQEIKARLHQKKDEKSKSSVFLEDKQRILSGLHSTGNSIGKTLQNVLPLVESGEISASDAEEFMETIAKRLAQLQKRNRNWKERLKVLQETLK